MSEKRLTDYSAKPSPTAADLLYCVDVADLTESPSGSTKKITIGSIPKDFVSVLNSGADNTGVADSFSAFTACMTNNPGKTILIPNGTYLLSADVNTTNVSWNVEPNVTFTGAGKFNPTRGFWTDTGNGANIEKASDRLFVGEAAEKSDGKKVSTQGTFLTTQMNAFWLERAATTLSVSGYGEFGGTFAARTSDKSKLGYYGSATIGVAAVVENDDASVNQTTGWAGYFEANRGVANKVVYGLEISLKNKGNDITSTPYNRNNWGTVGVWLPAGGDSAYNGVNANPCATGIMFGRGADHGNTALPNTWNRGIVFNADSLTGSDGLTGNGSAIEMAKHHAIRWMTPAGVLGAAIISRVDNGANSQTINMVDNQIQFLDNGQFATFVVGKGTGVANQIRIFSSAAASSPSIQANGSDTDIDLILVAKGAGLLRFGSFSLTADVPITGYITIKDNSGNVRKLAVVA